MMLRTIFAFTVITYSLFRLVVAFVGSAGIVFPREFVLYFFLNLFVALWFLSRSFGPQKRTLFIVLAAAQFVFAACHLVLAQSISASI